MDLDIAGKVALITGGDSGIGLDTARLLLKEKVRVCLSDLKTEGLERAVEELEELGEVSTIAADLTKPSEVDKLAQFIEKRYGTLHILVNSAGITGQTGDFLELEDEAWVETFESNLMSAVRCCRAFIPLMKKEKWGRIVLVASEDAVQPYPEEMPYCASKAGVLNLAKNLSKAYGGDGILTNCVSPAFIETPMTDAMMEKRAKELDISFEKAVETFLEEKRPHIELKRRGKPEEVAAVVAFLCSERASFVLGSTYRVDGGSVAGISI